MKPKSEAKYLVNLNKYTVHKFPAYESCNLDAISKPARKRVSVLDPSYRRCKRCFKAKK